MKALLLLSDGIDSPVAGFLMKEKGIELVALHFSHNEINTKKAKQLASKLNIKIYIIPYNETQKQFQKLNKNYQCIFCKRFMVKIAEQIAKKENCKYIITGDNLGQVASQTLENMYIIDTATDLPILRPLLTKDKQETMDIARKINTYDLSIQKAPSCPFVPKEPITKAKLKIIKIEENKLNRDIIEKALLDKVVFS
ncbi:MAG: 7-cyano-7-deazaguanine synthase [archaeon]